MNKWISVDERLPEVSREDFVNNYIYIFDVLTYDGEDIDVTTMYATLKGDGSISSVKFLSNSYRVTHWMPLPEPPEELK